MTITKDLTLVSSVSQKERIKRKGLKKYSKKYGKKISNLAKEVNLQIFF